MIRSILTVIAAATFLAITSLMAVFPVISGLTPVAIRSASMEPTIPIAALVYIQEQEQYAVGDVVTFRYNGENYTHRLVAEWTGNNEGPWRTQGDANSAPDAEILSTSAILGKAQFYIPYAGILSLLMRQPAVLAFIGLTALTILLWPALTRPQNAAGYRPASTIKFARWSDDRAMVDPGRDEQ